MTPGNPAGPTPVYSKFIMALGRYTLEVIRKEVFANTSGIIGCTGDQGCIAPDNIPIDIRVHRTAK